MRLVLASHSPRRRELLHAAGIEHTVRACQVDESVLPGEPPMAYVRRVAELKARAVECADGETILAADTTVVIEDTILGKPEDVAAARGMLRRLAGRRHEVITGICLRGPSFTIVQSDSTSVWFGSLSTTEIEAYVASGEPFDKAGAYAIQGLASRFVERIEGSYSNVVGLPIALVWRELQRFRSSPSSVAGSLPAV